MADSEKLEFSKNSVLTCAVCFIDKAVLTYKDWLIIFAIGNAPISLVCISQLYDEEKNRLRKEKGFPLELLKLLQLESL